MEQRRLRLGDILDDYCPRERRLTNHAVVAMVEETVKQTRCTTCDAEHAYKGGQTPRRRKKDGPSALYKEVLAGKADTDVPPGMDIPEVVASVDLPDDSEIEDGEVNGNVMAAGESRPPAIVSRPAPVVRREPARAVAPPGPDENRDQTNVENLDEDGDERAPDAEDGPVHRQLIRATLPRIEGHKEERRPTDFTIRQPGGGQQRRQSVPRRGRGRGRSDAIWRSRAGWQSRTGRQPRASRQRPSASGRPPVCRGARSGQGQGQGHGQGQGRGQGGGFRSAQQPRQGGGGRKRSR